MKRPKPEDPEARTNEVQILLNTRKITFGDIFAPLRLVSELPDLSGRGK